MKSLKSAVAVILSIGLLAAFGCSYKTCPAYTQHATPDSSQPLVASQALAD